LASRPSPDAVRDDETSPSRPFFGAIAMLERTAAVLEETLYLAIARPDMQITNMPLAISVDAHWGDYAFAP